MRRFKVDSRFSDKLEVPDEVSIMDTFTGEVSVISMQEYMDAVDILKIKDTVCLSDAYNTSVRREDWYSGIRLVTAGAGELKGDYDGTVDLYAGYESTGELRVNTTELNNVIFSDYKGAVTFMNRVHIERLSMQETGGSVLRFKVPPVVRDTYMIYRLSDYAECDLLSSPDAYFGNLVLYLRCYTGEELFALSHMDLCINSRIKYITGIGAELMNKNGKVDKVMPFLRSLTVNYAEVENVNSQSGLNTVYIPRIYMDNVMQNEKYYNVIMKTQTAV